MSKKEKRMKKSNASANLAPYEIPALPSLLSQPLGLEGWTSYEPILLAALASEEPLLLIGPHGSAKSFLLERLAKSLKLEFRFYNASLINYDDLVGIPMPDEERKSLRYISTPAAIWDAEVVFFDEINRTRPELQNKLFPIVHERRVQGVNLEKLRYRWSAMNPPPSAEEADDHADVYLGAEPLDPALADRFSFLIEVPGWQHLSEEEKRRIFRDQFKGSHDFPVPFAVLVESAKRHLEALQHDPLQVLEDYLLSLLGQLETSKILFSARRATMLHRNILAVHAARLALYESAFPSLPSGLIDWNTSALLALRNSIPQVAQGKKPDPALLLAAHRHAWEISRLDADNPWKELLAIKDPVERCMAGIRMGKRMDDGYLSQLILDALGSLENINLRRAAALAIYLAVHDKRTLRGTAYESLAQELRPVLQPGEHSPDPDDCPRARYRQVQEICAELAGSKDSGAELRNRYSLNLLQSLIEEGFNEITPRQVLSYFEDIWNQVVSSQQEEKDK